MIFAKMLSFLRIFCYTSACCSNAAPIRASSSAGQSWRLITAWSRVQVLPGPPKKHEGFGLRASFLLIRTVPCSSGCESLCAACHRPACRLQGLYWAVRTWSLSSPNSSASLHPSAFFWISTVRDRMLATVMILP